MLYGDKLPESTGDKLTAWGDGSNFPGETGLDFWGSFELHRGNDPFAC